MAGVLGSWTRSRKLPIDEDLRTRWQRLQTHVRDVAHLNRPPPKTESTLPANMVEHPRHVAAQLAPNAPLPSLPFRTLYLGGPEPTGNIAKDGSIAGENIDADQSARNLRNQRADGSSEKIIGAKKAIRPTFNKTRASTQATKTS